MAFPCPRCGDRYTQSLPMAYGSGTYVRNWRSRSGYRGTTVSQSLIGNLASPPAKRALWKPIVCLIFVALWFAPAVVFTGERLVTGAVSHPAAPVMGGPKYHRAKPVPAQSVPTPVSNAESLLLILAIGITLEGLLFWWLVRTIRFNRWVYPGLLRNWQLSFMCRQCGAVFFPPDAESLVVSPWHGG